MIRRLEHLSYGEAETVGVVQPGEEGSGKNILRPFNTSRELIRKMDKEIYQGL